MPKGAKPKNVTHCQDCGVNLDLDPKFTTGGYRLSRCKTCYNKFCIGRYKEYGAEFRSKPENKLRKKDLQLQNYYGITLEEYNKLMELQFGKCAICKQEESLYVDHEHASGDIRGLLCSNCNAALGMLEENPDRILSAYEYLQKTTWNKGMHLVKIGTKNVS